MATGNKPAVTNFTVLIKRVPSIPYHVQAAICPRLLKPNNLTLRTLLLLIYIRNHNRCRGLPGCRNAERFQPGYDHVLPTLGACVCLPETRLESRADRLCFVAQVAHLAGYRHVQKTDRLA